MFDAEKPVSLEDEEEDRCRQLWGAVIMCALKDLNHQIKKERKAAYSWLTSQYVIPVTDLAGIDRDVMRAVQARLRAGLVSTNLPKQEPE